MRNLRQDQSGLAAITVTLVILGIVTLITVGFATLMRREQRQALDQQLSTQAFYAAESGVNMGRKVIDTFADTPESYDKCDEFPLSGAELDLGNNSSVACVLVDVTPGELTKRLEPGGSWVTPIQLENGQNITKIRISWSGDSDTFASGAMAAGHHLYPRYGTPTTPGWGDTTTVLRAMVMPSTNDRDELIDDTYSAFLYPNASAVPNQITSKAYSLPTSPSEEGEFIDGNCNAANEPHSCSVDIDVPDDSTYLLRLKAIYSGANVVVQAFNGNTPQPIAGAQAEIDATGKAAEVLRRIKVSVPLESSVIAPDFAIETFESLCKRFISLPGESETRIGDGEVSGSTSGPYALSGDARTIESCKLDGFADLSDQPY